MRSSSVAVQFQGTTLAPCPCPDGPPSLYVVVDTEAEFDWSKPFARHLVHVSAMAMVDRAQAIFDRHGIRPVYVVDYPVATQPDGYRPLQAILARGGCEIGAHLHPWTNPPFEETVSVRNSFPGNLPPALEEAKFLTLRAAIHDTFGIEAQFYKAGRYGIGANTLAILERHGVAVDFSVLPGVDLRPTGGPDLRGLHPVSYLSATGRLSVVPMTRGHTGLLASHHNRLDRLLDTRGARLARLRGVLSRLRAFDRVSLTPEGTSVRDLRGLLTGLHRRGHRRFVMSYHSPSLVPGHTPYVRSESDLAAFLERIDAVCRYVLGPLGGRAGDPRELLPDQLRPVRNAS